MKFTSAFLGFVSLLLFVAAGAVHGAVPEVYRYMSDVLPEGVSRRGSAFEQGYFSEAAVTGDERQFGAVVRNIPIERDFLPGNPDKRPFPECGLNTFAARSQYVAQAFVVDARKTVKNLQFSLSSLKSASGELGVEQLLLRRALPHEGIENFDSDMLIKAGGESLKAGEAAQFVYFINVPAGTKSGVYRGSISVTGEGGASLQIPVSLEVLDFDLPAAEGAFGTFMGGHFPRSFMNFVPQFYNEDAVRLIFKFWKTRSLTSPTLGHIHPTWKQQGDRFIQDFSTLRKFAMAMKEAGLEGPLCIDTRFYGSLFAEQVEQRNPEYAGRAVELYKDAIKQLADTAETENWPQLLYFAEEEVGNPDNYKKQQYAKYYRALREAVPGRDYIVDNDIGYNRGNAIDRGNEHGFPLLQYNSFEQECLDRAKREGRTVWAYNMGFKRGSFGFVLERLGATGNHQWAEMWDTPKVATYIHSMPDGQGRLFTGKAYEQMQEGIADYRYVQLLKERIAMLREKENNGLADRLQGELDALVADIPITSNTVGQWNARMSEGGLNHKRWVVAMAILEAGKALGLNGERHAAETKAVSAAIKILPVEISEAVAANKDWTISAGIIENPVFDGKLDLDKTRSYGTTGTLRRMGLFDSNARAFASSDEEYRKRIACSYTQAWVAYNQEGLLINSVGNFATPGKDSKPKFDNGDGHLWSEDCMEYFFLVPGVGQFQLILTIFDKVVLITPDGQYLHEGIKIKSHPNCNPANGLAQEMLVPWSLFGLKSMPERDTVWRFNANREFHSWHELMTWAPVWEYFHEVNNWGNLHFSGESGDSIFKSLDFGAQRPGRNIITGVVKGKMEMLVLMDENGRTVQKAMPKEDGSFRFDFEIPNNPVETFAWKLAAANAPQRAMIIPVNGGPVLNIHSGTEREISGNVLKFNIFLCKSDMTARKTPLQVRLNNGSESVCYSGNFKNGGDNVVHIPTMGLAAGEWKLEFICDGFTCERKITLAPAVAR